MRGARGLSKGFVYLVAMGLGATLVAPACGGDTVSGGGDTAGTDFGGGIDLGPRPDLPGTYGVEPSIYKVTPPTGPAAGGTVVSIQGAGFRTGDVIYFGDVPSQVVKFVDASNLAATAPPGIAGTVDISVEDPEGLRGVFANGFTYYDATGDTPAPKILLPVPNTGPASGGTALMIQGTGFQPGASVYLDWKLIPSAVVASSEYITLVTPSLSPGTVDIAVTNPDGQSDIAQKAFAVYDNDAEGPRIDTVHPVAGSVDGGLTVTLTGTNLSPDSFLLLGGQPMDTWTVESDTRGTFVTPPHAPGMQSLAITNPNGQSAILSDGFLFYIEPPVAYEVAPTAGPLEGGNTVTLRGAHFVDGMKAWLGDEACAGLGVLSAGEATCVAPASAEATTVDLRLENPSGLVGTLPNAYTYGDFPTLSEVVPTSGPTAGGVVVLVLGEGLDDQVQIYFGEEPAPTVYYAGPSGVGVLLPAGEAGTVDVSARDLQGTVLATLPGAFTYEAPALPTGDKPSLAQVAPASGPTTGGTWVLLKGFNLPDNPSVRFGTTDSEIVYALSSTLLTARTPAVADAGTVDVRVTDLDSGAVADLAAGFTYYDAGQAAAPAPTIAWVKPGLGPETGGTLAILSGADFQDGAMVLVGGKPAATVTPVDGQTLTFVTPAGQVGPADLAVVNPDGQAATLPEGFVYTPAAAPSVSIAAVVPEQGSVAGGTTVTVSGIGFTPGFLAFLDGVPVDTTALGSTTFSLVTPAHAPGLVDMAVTNPDGSTAVRAGAFNFVYEQPFVAGVVPDFGPTAGGTQVLISGQGFHPQAQVFFGAEAATVDTALGTLITAYAPAGALGTVDVTVTNPDGLSDTLPEAYTYTEGGLPGAVTLVSVTPNYGPIAGGSTSTLVGSGFTVDTSVIVGSELATDVKLLDSKTLLVTMPAGPVGPKDVQVIVPNEGSSTLHNAFFHFDPDGPWPWPVLSAVDPVAGPTSGGTVARLDVTPAPAEAQVYVGGDSVTVLGADEAGHLVVSMPAHEPGVVDISVMMPDGKVDTLLDAFTYYVPGPDVGPPLLTQLTPTAGSTLGGDAVSFTGNGFTAGTQAFLGYQPLGDTTVADATGLSGVTPAHDAGLADAAVTRADGFSAILPAAFAYGAPGPEPTAVFPTVGHVDGGLTVAVAGTAFAPGAEVFLGGVQATDVQVPLSTVLTFTTPPTATPGPVDLTVVNPDGKTGTLPQAFTYTDEAFTNPPPQVLALTPDHGPWQGGTVLAIYGSGFQEGARVLFGGQEATVHLIDGGLATVTTPPGFLGPVDVTVLNPDGQSGLLGGAFTYIATPDPAPQVVGVTPPSGPEAGGTPVILTGAHLTGGGVGFIGYRPLSSWVVLNSAIATGTTAPGLAGNTDVVVTNGDGQSATLTDGFIYVGAPHIDSFDPGLGPVSGGTLVTLAGQHFASGARVTFGGVQATSVQVLSELVIKCMTPVAAGPGPAAVRVDNPDGQSFTSETPYTYLLPPVLTSVFPSQGTADGGAPVVVRGESFYDGVTLTVGGVDATDVVLVDAQTITARTPAGTAGETVDVRVANPDGQEAVLPLAYAYLDPASMGPAPTLTALRPPTGPTAGGTWGLADGADLQDGAQLLLGTVPAAAVEVYDATSARFVTAAAPAAGAVDVWILNPDGGFGSLAGGFTFVDEADLDATPEIASLTPDRGPTAGGTAVTVVGTELDAETVVFFDTAPALDVTAADPDVVVTTPSHEAGTVDVVVTDAEGQTTLVEQAFTFVPPPRIDSIVPTQGPSSGGTYVEISGANFVAGATPSLSSSVMFCEEYISDLDCVPVPDDAVTVVDDGLIAVTTPPHFQGLTDVAVINPDGQDAVAAQAFYFTPPPHIDWLEPQQGTTDGNEVVKIHGSGFQAGLTVKFSDNEALDVTVDGESQVTVTTPAGAPGPAAVLVTNPDGSSHTLSGGFLYIQPPEVLSVFPALGPEDGGTLVTIQGDGFVPESVITIGGAQVPAGDTVYVSKTMIQALTPPGVGPAAVRVDNPDGQWAVLGGGFLYIPVVQPPSITKVQPTFGLTGGGYLVSVYGNSFQDGAVVSFGSDAIGWVDCFNNVVKNVGTLIKCKAPAHPEGLVNVKVTNSDGQTGVLADGFEFTQPLGLPGLSYKGITPNRGPLGGGYPVTVYGQGFHEGIRVYFGKEASATWTQATAVTRLGPTLLRVTMPAAPMPGPVDVRLSNPPLSGPDDVVGLDAFVYGQSVFFEPKGHRLPIDASKGDIHAALFDANGDGLDDVIILHNGTGGHDDLFINTVDENGVPGKFIDQSTTNLPTVPTGSYNYYWDTRRVPTPADWDQDGDVDVLFSRSNGDLGLYQNNGDGTFALKDVGNWNYDSLQWMEAADLNCDGIPDLMITRYNKANVILVGRGDGTFFAPPSGTFPTVSEPSRRMAIADVDHDGDNDVLITNDNAVQNRLYYNNCNNTPLPPACAADIPGCTMMLRDGHRYAFCGDNQNWWNARNKCELYGYELVTVNDQAEQDFVVANMTGHTWISYTDQDAYTEEGTFVWPWGTSTFDGWCGGQPNNGSSYDCVIANNNADPKGCWDDQNCSSGYHYACEAPVDVACPAPWSFTDAQYGTNKNFPVSGFNTRDAELTDIDGDGWEDAVLVNWGQSTRIYFNQGGNFVNDDGLHFPQSEDHMNGYRVWATDVDQDNDTDLIVAKEMASGKYWPYLYLNDTAQGGAGVFTDATPVNMPAWRGEASVYFAVGDMNQDALPDIYVVKPDYQDWLLLNNGFAENKPPIDANRVGIGMFANNTMFGVPEDTFTATSCDTGDVDGDGDIDIVMQNHYSQGTVLWVNDGAGNFFNVTKERIPSMNVHYGEVKLVDLNNDGDLDMEIFGNHSGSGDGGFRQLVNDGLGSFTDVTSTNHPDNSTSWEGHGFGFGDIDEDGLVDFVGVGNRNLWRTLVNGGDPWASDGAYMFTRNNLLNTNSPDYWTDWRDILLVDLNADGSLDAYALRNGQNQLWHNDGTGHFTSVSQTYLPSVGDDSRRAVAVDVDFDGDVDLFVANNGTNRLHIGELDYKYADATATNLPAGQGGDTRDVVTADFDRDGYPDFFLVNYNQQKNLFLNEGGAVFGDFSASLPRNADGTHCACVADFDNSGTQDILLCGEDVDRIYLNKTPAP